MTDTTDRPAALRRFVVDSWGEPEQLQPASADASFRSYWRAWRHGETRIVMDSPPELEPVQPWLDIGERLAQAGLHVPTVYARDVAQGFLLIEDLGVRTYLPELSEQHVDALYGAALDALFRLQTDVSGTDLPAYDAERLLTEMQYLPPWLLQRHLGHDLSAHDGAIVENALQHIAGVVDEQPKVFVHRDFHSRNLLVTEINSPGIIDFQGALYGPLTYDLVSLLRDCYIAWPPARVDAWVETYRQRLHAGTGLAPDSAQFRRWLDYTGLQRHIKVLGLFCRLCYRDGKAQYLHDLPLVLQYTLDVAARYAELDAFSALLRGLTATANLQQQRDSATAAIA